MGLFETQKEQLSIMDDKKFLGVRVIALAEMSLFFAIFLAWDLFFGLGDRMVDNITHPFWVIILLMSVQYGTIEGLVAVFLSTVVIYLFNFPEQYIDESYFEYQFRIYKLPFLWLFATLLVGELQGRKQRQFEELKIKFVSSELREKEIARAYEFLRTTKERLEGRLAGQLRSSISTYQALKSLEETKPAKVLLGLEGIVRSIMEPKKFSVYALGHTGLEASINSGWEEEDNFIRRFPQDSELYLNIVGRQKMLCALRREDQKILNREGILAAPLIDEESKAIFGMLKIEELEIDELNLSNIESFRLICESAGLAYANAMNYQKLQRNAIYDAHFNVFSPQYMSKEATYMTQIVQAVDLPLASVRVIFNQDKLDKDKLHQAVETLKHLSQTILGPLSQLFFVRGGTFILLVPFVHEKTLKFSLEMLKKEIANLDWFPVGGVEMRVDWLHGTDEGLFNSG